jgi:hypothetical protein
LIETLDKLINECLLASQTLPGVNPEETQLTQFKCVEVLGLLMILDISKFDRYIEIFIKTIDNERSESHKSKSVGIILKTIFDALRVHSYMKLQRLPNVPEDQSDLQEKFNQKKLRLRQLLMRQFRDFDFNVRLISTEGFCRMLMSQSCDKPIDFIARLMLLCFEKVDTGPRQLTEQDLDIHKKIKLTIEEFMGNYVRLSKGRCTEITAAAIAVIHYLLKAKSNVNTSLQFKVDPSFL